MYTNSIFKLFPSVKLVTGKNNDALYDLQHSKYYSIPKSLSYIIQKCSTFTISQLFDLVQEKEILEFYLNFLIQKDLGIISSTPLDFAPINNNFEYPNQIMCAIMDFNSESDYPLKKVIDELNQLRCRFLEIRFFQADIRKLYEILSYCNTSTLNGIELLFPYSDKFDDDVFIRNLKIQFPRITKFIIHSAPIDHAKLKENHDYLLIITPECITDESCCGVTNLWYCQPNLKLFLMSLNVNNCLWGKISIDKKGFIKNCPSMEQNFGHCSQINLNEVLSNPDFKKLWNIKKDDISVCKDCERRYMCQDCRAYRKNPDDLYSKPAKCTYFP